MYGNIFYNPAQDVELLQQAMNDLFSGVSGAVHEFPPVNVWTNRDGAVAKAELPGVTPENLEILVQNDVLTLKGSRPAEALKEGEQWLRRERPTGQFSRTLKLPFKVESNAVAAEFNKGVLTVKLPRAESDKPRKIEIKAA
jgi:HSP20 family protein